MDSTLEGNLGTVRVDTPIWDVLAPRGKREWVGERLSTGSRSPGYPIRQAVPIELGLAFGRICGRLWLG